MEYPRHVKLCSGPHWARFNKEIFAARADFFAPIGHHGTGCWMAGNLRRLRHP
jgi:hypothetical protein